jgi:hypothetical protein
LEAKDKFERGPVAKARSPWFFCVQQFREEHTGSSTALLARGFPLEFFRESVFPFWEHIAVYIVRLMNEGIVAG